MNNNTLRITTSNVAGARTNTDYLDATYVAEGGWLVIQHADQQSKRRLVSRVPLANIINVMERVPETKN